MQRLFAATLFLFVFTTGCTAQTRRANFAPAGGSPFVVGTQPVHAAVADVNGDGRLDIVTANAGSNNVSILLGDGRGGFRAAAGSPVAAPDKAHLVAVGDLNGDGHLDLAVTTHDSNEVWIFAGDGTGRFTASAPVVAFSGVRPHNHGLVLGDVNGDGKLDITFGHQEANAIAVLLNDGRGKFHPAAGSPVPVGRWPYPHALADVNKDGKLDLVVPLVGGNAVMVLLGDGKGGFTKSEGASPELLPRPYSVGVADFNRDGNLDVAAMHDDVARMSVLLGDGRGGWRMGPGSPLVTGVRGANAVAADLNGDGILDLAFAARQLYLMAGDGKGGFAAMAGAPSGIGQASWFVVVADVNGDVKADVVMPSPGENAVIVLLAK